MKKRMIAARTFLGLSSLLMATFVLAQQAEEIIANTNFDDVVLQPTYMVKGQPVKLLPSELYGAFAVSASDISDFETEVAQTGSLAVERSKLTDGYGIVLTRRLPSATDDGFSDAIAALETNNESFAVFGGGVSEKVLINEFIVRFSTDVSDQEAERQLQLIGAQILRKSRFTLNKYTIAFAEDLPIRALAKVNAMAMDRAFIFATPNFITIQPSFHRADIPGAGFAAAVPDSELSSLDGTTPWPNDEEYDWQWGMKHANAEEAWHVTTGSCEIAIAVIDVGIDTDHDDLINKITGKYDAIDGDDDPEPDVGDAHGTAVAGVAAAESNNEIGIAGTSWGSKIIAVKIFDRTYSEAIPDSSAITTPEKVQHGIEKAIWLGADILNNSWKYDPSDAIGNIIEDAITNENRVFVFAVGNTNGDVAWPANMSTYTDVIAVGAAAWPSGVWQNSNSGPVGNEVTLVAPGQHITSTDNAGDDGWGDGDYVLAYFGQTSAAAPFVSGAAALLLSWYPGATPNDVRGWLTGSANKSAVAGSSTAKVGAGLLDIRQALDDVGSTGISLDVSLVPDAQLGFLDVSRVRVKVTRNGIPLGGAMVTFDSQDETVAAVSTSAPLVAAGCDGVAEALVKSKSFGWMARTTFIQASVLGVTQSVLVTSSGILLPGSLIAVAIFLIVLIVWVIRRPISPTG